MIYNLSHGLLQVLVNLINNSKDALKQNNNEDKYIFIATINREDSIELIITDTGGGISQEVIGQIFEPYFTTKQKTNGTGLGLHMAFNIIEQNMCGKISASTKDFIYNDKDYIGASFSIVLDIVENKEG
jgi:C4-dicarboxylate-specific signal transduction histidine kinase